MADTATVEQSTTTAPIADDGFGDVTPTVPSDKPTSTTTTDDKPADSDDQSKAEGTKAPEESKPDDAATRKAHNDEMAKQRIAEREQRKAAEQQTTETDKPAENGDTTTEPATPEDFLSKLEADIAKELEQVDDETDKRLKTIEARQYVNEAKAATNQLVFDHGRVQADIPLFNPTSPEFNQEAYEFFVGNYEAAHTTKDANGVIWPKASLYQYMKGAADLLSGISQKGALKGQQAEARMRAKADAPSSAGEKKSTLDPTEEAFMKGFGTV
jgi:hypothetical protein